MGANRFTRKSLKRKFSGTRRTNLRVLHGRRGDLRVSNPLRRPPSARSGASGRAAASVEARGHAPTRGDKPRTSVSCRPRDERPGDCEAPVLGLIETDFCNRTYRWL